MAVKDLDSLKELIARVRRAQEEFSKFDQETVDKIFRKVAQRINDERITLAKMAVEETGMGILKNLKRLSVEGETKKEQKLVEVEVNVLLDGEKISIEKFNCCTATGINMDTLFGELLRRN